ncbi:type II toxin-antitoxin system HipA family toxin [Luteibacter aegosomatissinici]|uniref:type II toxin-antitoxin system HipA family toxin n=1 Tax=Luteibacter aegosomatissinici TaxID=2911539 RepID=UPI001FF84111|nr:type II toxin-antitoxin system HipA family toxin [Luteibacter aegosomatissinici]UPG95313.1 type II toxin-antitoxin system HipA family toxin [Luteibacter aegosomatissinici]
MSESAARVALGEGLVDVGRLRFTRHGSRQFSAFSYDTTWLGASRAFAIQPSMPLTEAPFFNSAKAGDSREALAGAFTDAAPDSWGRRLLERAYGSGLSEFDYLTLSDDRCRQGALRFLDERGDVLRGNAGTEVPRLLQLEEITAIARHYEQGDDLAYEDLMALAGAGASGGARPKANVTNDRALWLAKFTSLHDQRPIERVEVATLKLAQRCGIRTPEVRLELADTPFPVALIKRFDRRGDARIPYISARTALDKAGGALGAYTEIIDFMRAFAPSPGEDFRELFRRVVFTILVSNKDDHLQNHGFLYVGSGRWRLSPMFDVNPAPDREPQLETAIVEGGGHERSIRLALDACRFFELHADDARDIIRSTARIIDAHWQDALRGVGVTGAVQAAYRAAFVNDQSMLALKL